MKPLPPSLYQITAELSALEIALENDTLSPDLSPDIMNTLIVQIQEKADAVVGFENYMQDQVESIDARIEELAAYKKAITSKLTRLDQYVASCLKHLGTNKLEGKIASITRRAPTDIVIITDESALPMDFLRTKVEPEKVKIKDALKNGVAVPGAVLEKSQSISITYKNRKPLSRKEAAASEGEA